MENVPGTFGNADGTSSDLGIVTETLAGFGNISRTLTDFGNNTNFCCNLPEWSLNVVVVYMTIIILIGVPGNALIVLILSGVRTKFSTDYYILTMAFFDFICAGLNAPLYIVRNIEKAWDVYASPEYCQIHLSLLYMTNMSTTLLLTAVALDRYFVTCRPHTRVGTLWNMRTIYVNVSIAMCSLGFAIAIGLNLGYEPETRGCSFTNVGGLVISFVLTAMFVGLFITAVICYSKICLTLRVQQKLIAAANRDMTSVTMDVSSVTTNSRKRIVFSFQRSNTVVPNDTPHISARTTDNGLPYNLRTGPAAAEKSSRNLFNTQSSGLQRPKLFTVPFENYSSQNANEVNVTRSCTTNPKRTVPERPVTEPKAKRNNKITLIVFLLTAIYIFTWTVNWSFQALETNTATNAGIKHVARKLFMVTSITNPIFYILLSSKFRERMGILCCRRKKRTAFGF